MYKVCSACDYYFLEDSMQNPTSSICKLCYLEGEIKERYEQKDCAYLKYKHKNTYTITHLRNELGNLNVEIDTMKLGVDKLNSDFQIIICYSCGDGYCTYNGCADEEIECSKCVKQNKYGYLTTDYKLALEYIAGLFAEKPNLLSEEYKFNKIVKGSLEILAKGFIDYDSEINIEAQAYNVLIRRGLLDGELREE